MRAERRIQSGLHDAEQISRGDAKAPSRPLKEDYSLDLPTFERLLDFHVARGAPRESRGRTTRRSRSICRSPERKLFCRGRRGKPWRAGSRSPSMSARLAGWRILFAAGAPHAPTDRRRRHPRHHARISGTRRAEAIYDYFRALATFDRPAGHLLQLPRGYLAGVEITGELMSRLIERLPNFAGVKGGELQQREILGDLARPPSSLAALTSPC